MTYPITRQFGPNAKGSELTFADMDNNLLYLDAKVTGSDNYIPMYSGSRFLTSSIMYQLGSNIGIGTPNPGEKLEVVGNINIPVLTGKIGFFVNDDFIAYGSSSAHYGMSYIGQDSTVILSGYSSLRMFTLGTERLSILSNGNVGIGTTAPTVPLNVSGDTIITGSTILFNNGGTLDLRGTNHSYIQWYPDNNSTRRAYFGFAASGSTNIILENENASGNIAIITNGGFIGINKYVPTSPLDVVGNAIVTGSLNVTNGITGSLLGTSSNSTTSSFASSIGSLNQNVTITGSLVNRLITNPTRTNPHIRLDYSSSTANPQTDQAIGIIAGYTPFYDQYGPYIKFVAQGNWTGGQYPAGIEFYTQQQTGGTEKLTLSLNQNGVIEFNNYTSNGTVTTTGANGTISVSSDKNLKTADGFIENGIEKVMALKPRYFYWKPTTGFGNARQLGFYAQEVNSVSEEAANTPSTGQQWGIYDRALIAILTKAIQEQQTQIEELKLQVATLING